MACCFHELVGPTSNKAKKIKGQKKEKTIVPKFLTEEKVFNWIPEHQQTFDALKEALVTASVMDYPDFNR